MEQKFKAKVVWLILDGKVEKALEILSEHFKVETPKIRVGLPKGHKKKAFGCYNPKSKMIFVLNSDVFKEPFTILHEFYHHLRTAPDAKHKGTEKHANMFAKDFVHAYKSTVAQVSGNN